MRLDDKTRSIIKNEVAKQFRETAVVRLFGSRVDDTQRGGDIDLFIVEQLVRITANQLNSGLSFANSETVWYTKIWSLQAIC